MTLPKVDTFWYEWESGKAPKGYGRWEFRLYSSYLESEFTGHHICSEDTVIISDTYGNAKKALFAKLRGWRTKGIDTRRIKLISNR